MITGEINTIFKPHQINQDYLILKDYLKNDSGDYRSLWVPEMSRYAWRDTEKSKKGLVRLTNWYRADAPMTVRGKELQVSFICPSCKHISQSKQRIEMKTYMWMESWANDTNQETPERCFTIVEDPNRKGWIAMYGKAVVDEDLLLE